MKTTKSKRRSFSPVIIVLLIIGLLAIGYNRYLVPTIRLQKAVEEAVDKWVMNQPQYQTFNRIVKGKIISEQGNVGEVGVLVLFTDSNAFEWFPLEAVTSAEKINGDWVLQPIGYFESPFVVKVMTSKNSQCLPVQQRTPTDNLCLEITNKGNFDWEWDHINVGAGNTGYGSTTWIDLKAQTTTQTTVRNMSWGELTSGPGHAVMRGQENLSIPERLQAISRTRSLANPVLPISLPEFFLP